MEEAIVDVTTITEFPVDPFTTGLHETQAVLFPRPADGERSMIVLSRSRAFRWNANEGETKTLKPMNPGYIAAGSLSLHGTRLLARRAVGSGEAHAGGSCGGGVAGGGGGAPRGGRLTAG